MKRLFARSIPPAAAPFTISDIMRGLAGLAMPQRTYAALTASIQHAFDVPYVFFVSSGTAALYLVLKALKEIHPDRHEVLIPAYTCFSVPSAIVAAGLTVRICDVDSQTLDFDTIALRNQLTDTKSLLCIVPTHLFGSVAVSAALKQHLADPAIMIVEDAAQAMGMQCNGAKVGTAGDAAIFSLGRGKSVSAVAGGIILTRNKTIADNIAHCVKDLPQVSMVAHIREVLVACALSVFIRPSFFWIPQSLPLGGMGENKFDTHFPVARLSPFAKGLTVRWEKNISHFAQSRSSKNDVYRKAFVGIQGLHMPSLRGDDFQGTIRFPLIIENLAARDRILTLSKSLGLGIVRMYPLSIDSIPEIAGATSDTEQSYKGAHRLALGLITLPNHCLVRMQDCNAIMKCILNNLA